MSRFVIPSFLTFTFVFSWGLCVVPVVSAEGTEAPAAPASEPVAEPVVEKTEEPVAEPVVVSETPVATGQCQGDYKTGSAPFPPKTKVSIGTTPDGISVQPQKGEAWTIPMKRVRGAQSSPGGLWFYWYDESDTTLHAQFKMESGQDQCAIEITAAAKQFHEAEMESKRRRFEEYEKEALKQAQ